MISETIFLRKIFVCKEHHDNSINKPSNRYRSLIFLLTCYCNKIGNNQTIWAYLNVLIDTFCAVKYKNKAVLV